jgi:signal transduction histidine kinase
MANDLQVILTQIESAEILLPGDSMTRQFCEITKGAAERMYNLMTIMGKVEEKQQMNLESAFENLVEQMLKSHRRLRINLDISELAKGVNMTGISLLPAIVGNLIRNADQHGGEGVTVDLTIDSQNKILEITVADDGNGVPDIIKDRLFQRGASTSGGGQGLYLSKRIVEGYGGSIELNESNAKGATFRIEIPLS